MGLILLYEDVLFFVQICCMNSYEPESIFCHSRVKVEHFYVQEFICKYMVQSIF